MRPAHLLVIAFLLSCTWLCAQENQPSQASAPVGLTFDSHSAISGPLRFEQPATVADPLLRLQATHVPVFNLDTSPKPNRLLTPSDMDKMLLSGDTFCLKMRSYLVARDSRRSDSTHLVGYSTCQPANRYRLRTAVGSDQSEP